MSASRSWPAGSLQPPAYRVHVRPWPDALIVRERAPALQEQAKTPSPRPLRSRATDKMGSWPQLRWRRPRDPRGRGNSHALWPGSFREARLTSGLPALAMTNDTLLPPGRRAGRVRVGLVDVYGLHGVSAEPSSENQAHSERQLARPRALINITRVILTRHLYPGINVPVRSASRPTMGNATDVHMAPIDGIGSPHWPEDERDHASSSLSARTTAPLRRHADASRT